MLANLELVVRIAGGIGLLVMTVVVMISVLRFRSREAGVTVGVSPRKLYSPWVLAVGSLISLVVCVLLWRPVISRLPDGLRWLLLAAGAVPYFAGLWFIIWGRIALGKYHNVSSSMGAQLFEGHKLITSGPFAIVRNPMYFGFLVMIIGGLLLYRTWTIVLFALCWPIFLKRARVEEQALEQAFGDEYLDYTHRVPWMFPRLVRTSGTTTRQESPQ